jgi:hydrogenase nickel incorporation protein HypB
MRIPVLQKILSANDRVAQETREKLSGKGIMLVNLMGSPGSGKTALLEKTIRKSPWRIGVIEGDIWGSLDAQRLAKLKVPTCQINTGPFGGDCHLEASWVKSAIDRLPTQDVEIIFVENVGNLVCPAEFDIGAHLNVVALSITEGEDKPLKYPLAFRSAGVCLITKTDLLPHLHFSLAKLKKNIARIHPAMEVIAVSAQAGKGLDQWRACLARRLPKAG